MTYNPKIHHRRSIRLKAYDYSCAGLYFITICCQDRVCLFGEILNGKMILNDGGKIANACWLEIPNHFPNARLHKDVVMPNHVHGIIELTNPTIDCMEDRIGIEKTTVGVGVENFQPRRGNKFQKNEFQKIIPRSIGSIVRGYKIGVTKWFRTNTRIDSVWQRNYYEHIIRNEKAYDNISIYIINNPVKWKGDRFSNK